MEEDLQWVVLSELIRARPVRFLASDFKVKTNIIIKSDPQHLSHFQAQMRKPLVGRLFPILPDEDF